MGATITRRLVSVADAADAVVAVDAVIPGRYDLRVSATIGTYSAPVPSAYASAGDPPSARARLALANAARSFASKTHECLRLG